MKGLIIKDLLNLRKSFRITLVMSLLFFAYAYGMNNPPYLIGMATILFAILSLTSMSYDEATKWDRYALSMPISRKNIVGGKYLLAIILAFVAVLVSFGISYILILPKSDMLFLELWLVAYAVFGVAIVYISSIFPLIYKFGVEKSRIMSLALFALPAMVVLIAYKVGVKMPSEAQFMLMLKLSPLVLLLILGFSYFISLKIFSYKEL